MKRFFHGATALFLTLALLAPTAAFAAEMIVPTSQALSVDGRAQSCEVYNIDGSNYFKLRDLAYLLDGTGSRFSVGWDEATRTVTVTTGAAYTPNGGELALRQLTEAELRKAGRSPQTILINGAANASLRAYLIGENNFFNLRDLGAALGFDVDYDTESRTMLVTSRPPQGGGQTVGAARLGLTADAGRDYLDKIIFLGDSTTYGIGYYYRQGYTELCPPRQVWTPKSGTLTLSYYNIATVVYPETNEEIPIAEAVRRATPEILCITLGVNGISFMDEEWFIRDYTALVRLVQEASPDTRIILNSIYPVADSYAYLSQINNQKINAANGWIERIAADTGARFLYSWEAVAVDGKLPETSQNGDGLHLTGEAFTAVMQYVRTHAYL